MSFLWSVALIGEKDFRNILYEPDILVMIAVSFLFRRDNCLLFKCSLEAFAQTKRMGGSIPPS